MKAQAEAEEAAYKAAEEAAKAKTAMIAAEVAARNAGIGTVTGQTVVGGITTPQTGTAQAEALLLYTRSTNMAAEAMFGELKNAIPSGQGGKHVLIITDASQLACPDAVQFDIQLHAVGTLQAAAERQYQIAREADGNLDRSDQGGGNRMMLAPLSLAGTLLDSAAKLGSYFATDYAFGNVSITAPANLTAAAVVSAFRRHAYSPQFIMPANFGANDASEMIAALAPVQNRYAAVAGLGAAAKARAAALASGTGPAQNVAALYQMAEAAATKATTAYETLINGLTTVTGGQEAPVIRVIRQRLIQRELKGKALVLLISTSSAGAYYTKKNLWTFLGGPPLYTMGGISVAYALYDSETGNVLGAGAIAKHGGYRSVRAVERLFP
jgi:hypothetical protein